MSTPPLTTGRRLGLAGLAVAAVVVLSTLMASAAGDPSGDGPATCQEYLILDLTHREFITLQDTRQFLNELGQDGWIVPDGTRILAHTFKPGTSAQYTRFIIHTGTFDEEGQFLLLRRAIR